MSVDFIGYHSLLVAQASTLAAQESAFWAKVTGLISAVSVIATFVAAYVAYKALGQWRLQLHEDNRVKLIDSLISFNTTVVAVPKDIMTNAGENNIFRKNIVSVAGEVCARFVIFDRKESIDSLKENMHRFRTLVTSMLNGEDVKVELSLITNTMIMGDLTS
ncbi:hypothetical protein VC506_01815 [Citrobacter freundii]|uniref:hypothetical protein n=1 Tax=Citrobacter freundii TaxID=546 RepID=UPI001904BE57|nr:hypothetical protein [Citrobacter freundii]ELK7202975.1 hypothetical protein [Citrobacter freundii]MBJ8944575.1 hypothetical protein [Citrobacter freundii]MBX8903719.1 hypothetical protein [Citrobacter freundii]MEB0320961.1 hypothetical protein [Citrobacter freundii]MEB0341160.1 hypothetical protein [Citrobacter freundii]